MKTELRIIKASFMTGVSEAIIGVFMSVTGLHEWYYEHFKFFGVLGIGMILYSYWHYKYYVEDMKWKEKKTK